MDSAKAIAEQAVLKDLAAGRKTYALSGPVNAERDVVCELKISGRVVRAEDIDALHDFVMLLAQAFHSGERREQPPAVDEVQLSVGGSE